MPQCKCAVIKRHQ